MSALLLRGAQYLQAQMFHTRQMATEENKLSQKAFRKSFRSSANTVRVQCSNRIIALLSFLWKADTEENKTALYFYA